MAYKPNISRLYPQRQVPQPTQQSLAQQQWRKTVRNGRKRFYVRPSGGSYGTADGLTYATAWNGFSNIDWSSVENNTLAVCGTHNETLSVGANNVRIVGNDPNEAGVITTTGVNSARSISMTNRTGIVIDEMTCTSDAVECLLFDGDSTATVNGGTYSGGSGQCIQLEEGIGNPIVTFNNVTAGDSSDDALSVHAGVATVNGGTYRNSVEGIAVVNNGQIIVDGPTLSNNSGTDITLRSTGANTVANCTVDNAIYDTGNNNTFTNCTIGTITINGVRNAYFYSCIIGSTATTLAGASVFIEDSLVTTGFAGSMNYDVKRSRIPVAGISNNGYTFAARHCYISRNTGNGVLTNNGGTLDIAYCIVDSANGTNYIVADLANNGSITMQNCNIIGKSGTERGIFWLTGVTINNTIFTDIGSTFDQSTPNYVNCCFFNIATSIDGTQTASQTGDPNYTDAAGLDFSLATGSSCIGTGKTLSDSTGIVSADWGNGTTEIPVVVTGEQSASWNIGAYV